jgi:hypothetical protein
MNLIVAVLSAAFVAALVVLVVAFTNRRRS